MKLKTNQIEDELQVILCVWESESNRESESKKKKEKFICAKKCYRWKKIILQFLTLDYFIYPRL